MEFSPVTDEKLREKATELVKKYRIIATDRKVVGKNWERICAVLFSNIKTLASEYEAILPNPIKSDRHHFELLGIHIEIDYATTGYITVKRFKNSRIQSSACKFRAQQSVRGVNTQNELPDICWKRLDGPELLPTSDLARIIVLLLFDQDMDDWIDFATRDED